MIFKILITLLVVGLNVGVYILLKRQYSIRAMLLSLLILPLTIALGFKISSSSDSSTIALLALVIFFSLAIILLTFMMRLTSQMIKPTCTRIEHNHPNTVRKIRDVRSFLITKLMPVMVTLFQLMLIWGHVQL